MNEYPELLCERLEALEAELAERLEWNKACIESTAIASAEISKLQTENKKLQNELKKRPAEPLFGEARSRLLKAMNCGGVDGAVTKFKRLEAENKELRERITELEQHNNNFHEGLKEAMKPENWQQ